MCWPFMLWISTLHRALHPRCSSPPSPALFDRVCSRLSSFFMPGNLLSAAWVHAASGGITMTSARLFVMAQYIVCPSSTSTLMSSLRQSRRLTALASINGNQWESIQMNIPCSSISLFACFPQIAYCACEATFLFASTSIPLKQHATTVHAVQLHSC